MKRCLLLTLLAFGLFSCQEEMPVALKEGYYSISISCNNAIKDYSSDLMIDLIKIDEYTYEFYEIYGGKVSPKSKITVYNLNRMKGTIYTYSQFGWVKGKIDGEINNDTIKGLFDGNIVFSNELSQATGRFRMEYKELDKK